MSSTSQTNKTGPMLNITVEPVTDGNETIFDTAFFIQF